MLNPHLFCFSLLGRVPLVAALVGLLGASGRAAVPPEAPAVSTHVRILTAVANGFMHPGIGVTGGQLERARAQVLAGREPWMSYYRRLAASPLAARDVACRNESPTHPGQPENDAFDSRSMQARLDLDGSRARAQALMYFFTGDGVYRANALRIIRVWSGLDPAKCRTYPDAHIHAGWPLKFLLTAAEILRYTHTDDPALAWTDADTRRLTDNVVDPLITKLMNENGWFMNQNNFAIHGAMAGFIFTNNRDGYDQRVEWFTVNRTAPNPGWDGSIRQLARLVDTDALTGAKVEPQVQLVELGRDGAHAAEDVNLFVHIANLMEGQGTRIDPVTGIVSTAPNAVSAYDFLERRILAVADYACRYMLGYDTRWIPVAYDIDPEGRTRRIYPRLSDQYRGRMTTFGFWHLYLHAKYEQGIDVPRVAPYFYDALQKRITDLDWLLLPVEAEQEAAFLMPAPELKDVLPLARRVTLLSPDVTVATAGGEAFVRATPASSAGARFALLSAATPSPTVALRVRASGGARVKLAGFAKPLILPETGDAWTYVPYTFGEFEMLDNIAFLQVEAAPGSKVDFAEFVADAPLRLAPPRFATTESEWQRLAYVGAPVTLDCSATGAPDRPLAYRLQDAPPGAMIDGAGRVTWTPLASGIFALRVVVTDGRSSVARAVTLEVMPDAATALARLRAMAAALPPLTRASRTQLAAALVTAEKLPVTADATARFAAHAALESALTECEFLSPTLADGSLDFLQTAVSPDGAKTVAALVDGNDDTFVVYRQSPDRNLTFDFGGGYGVIVNAVTVEGRLNFEERAEGSVLLGSHDGTTWVRLTPGQTVLSTGPVRLEVEPALRAEPFRYLRLQKLTDGLFEPCELRLEAQRVEVP